MILIVMWIIIGAMQMYIQLHCHDNCHWRSYWLCYLMTMCLLLERNSWGG
jgi:hypothetical protein